MKADQFMLRRFHEIEAGLILCIRPKPRWMPGFVYEFLISRVLYLEQFSQPGDIGYYGDQGAYGVIDRKATAESGKFVVKPNEFHE